MIGLEFICKEFTMQYKQIAEVLEVKTQTINSWLRGKRKIPCERLKQLSEMEIFKGIPENYFGKQLSKLEESKVVEIRIRNTMEEHMYTNTFEDEDGNTVNTENTWYDTTELKKVLHERTVYNFSMELNKKLGVLKQLDYSAIEEITIKTIDLINFGYIRADKLIDIINAVITVYGKEDPRFGFYEYTELHNKIVKTLEKYEGSQ